MSLNCILARIFVSVSGWVCFFPLLSSILNEDIALIKNNARVGSCIAVALNKLQSARGKRGGQPQSESTSAVPRPVSSAFHWVCYREPRLCLYVHITWVCRMGLNSVVAGVIWINLQSGCHGGCAALCLFSICIVGAGLEGGWGMHGRAETGKSWGLFQLCGFIVMRLNIFQLEYLVLTQIGWKTKYQLCQLKGAKIQPPN